MFANLTLHAKKQVKVALRIGVPQCQALGPVTVGAAAYQLDDNGLVTCSTTATPATVEVVKQPHKAKRAAWDAGTCVACLDYQQVGPKLIGTGYARSPFVFQGASASLSDDGRTLAVGAYADGSNVGATWLFTREPTGAFTQLGSKLVGTAGAGVGQTGQGLSLAMSGNGQVLVVGGYGTSSSVGGAFVFRQVSPGTWEQVGSGPFVGSNPVGSAYENHVSINHDGSVFAVGNSIDNGNFGAAYVFRDPSGTGAYTQWSGKLVGTGNAGAAQQGVSVSLDAVGTTLAVGGFDDNSGAGAVWIFKAVNNVWTQVGAKLATDTSGPQQSFGFAVALSSDGLLLAAGGKGDAGGVGATWLWRDLVGDGTYPVGLKTCGERVHGRVWPRQRAGLFGKWTAPGDWRHGQQQQRRGGVDLWPAGEWDVGTGGRASYRHRIRDHRHCYPRCWRFPERRWLARGRGRPMGR